MRHQHYEKIAYSGGEFTYDVDDYERFLAIKSLIPAGVQRILDCGCGDGSLGHLLKDEYAVQGCDIALEPLKHCEFPSVQCSLTKLPFDDNYFDLSICSEVLEHILPMEYERACQEIERVTRKWLIVTVPYREDLDYARQRCPHCGTIFHDAWHIRSMDKKTLANSFPGFLLKRYFYIGHKQRLDHILRIRLRNRLLGYPRLQPNRQCPLCGCVGTLSGEQKSRSFSKDGQYSADNRPVWYKKLRRWALKIVPGRPRWLGAVLEAASK